MSMGKTELEIKIYGSAVLRRKAAAVKTPEARHRELLSEMARFMYEHSGIGLAAPQVGCGESLIVVDIGTGLYKLINPRIIRREGSQAIEEGCLSLPGVSVKVKRAKKITLKALDHEFNPVTVTAEGLLACVFQHEIDHLKGRMIVDYASLLDKVRLKKKLAELYRRAGNEDVRESGAEQRKLRL